MLHALMCSDLFDPFMIHQTVEALLEHTRSVHDVDIVSWLRENGINSILHRACFVNAIRWRAIASRDDTWSPSFPLGPLLSGDDVSWTALNMTAPTLDALRSE